MAPFSKETENALLREAFGCVSKPEGWQHFFDKIDAVLNCKSIAVEYGSNHQPTNRFFGSDGVTDLTATLTRSTTDQDVPALAYLLQVATPHHIYCLEANHLSEFEDAPQTAKHQATKTQSSSIDHWPAVCGVLKSRMKTTVIAGLFFPNANNHEPLDQGVVDCCRKILQIMEYALTAADDLNTIQRESDVYKAIAEYSAIPCVVINQDLEILTECRSGLDTLTALDAAASKNGKLVFRNLALESEVQNAFACTQQSYAATEARPPATGSKSEVALSDEPGVCLRDETDTMSRVTIQRIAGQTDCNPACLVLHVRHPAQIHEGVEELLQTEFGLSHSEAHLAHQLAVTGSVPETVERLNITRNTMKTHLRSIYDKTGAHTQLQLVHLVHQLSGLV